MLPLRNEGHREPRKRRPERSASEKTWTVGASARLAATGHGTGLGEKADGDDSSTFAQRRSRLWAVMACRAGGAGAGKP